MSAPLALITGAAGFIGRSTVREFVQRGWRVCALIHRHSAPDLEAPALRAPVHIVRGDVTEFASLQAIFRDAAQNQGRRFDAVIHCVGRASDVGRDADFRRANFESVRHLVELMKQFDIGRFVFVSTTDVYGLRDFSGEPEDALTLPAGLRHPYPRYKFAAERFIRKQLPPERYAIVRPAAVWGVGDSTLTPRIVSHLRRWPWIVHFGRWRGCNRWPLAYVRNVTAALFLAATSPDAAGQTFNVLDSERTTIDAFCRMIASVYFPDRTYRSITLPLWLGLVMGGFISGISNALRLEKPFTDPTAYAARSVAANLDFDNGRFVDLMKRNGMRLVTREEGMEELQKGVEDLVSPDQ